MPYTAQKLFHISEEKKGSLVSSSFLTASHAECFQIFSLPRGVNDKFPRDYSDFNRF